MATTSAPAALAIHLGETGWGIVAALAMLMVIGFGLPFLGRGGGLLRRRGRGGYGRGGYGRGRGGIRVGPSWTMVITLGLARRLSGLLLAVVTLAYVVLVVLNARA